MSPHVLPSHCSPASMIPSPQIPPKGVMQPEVSSTQALVQDKSPSVKSPRSVQFRMGPKFLPSHCSPGLMKPSPQLVPLPPKHEAVLNWHAASQLRLPRGKPKSLHPVTLPHEEPSHCSPASITPSPQFPPVGEAQLEVSRRQSAWQLRNPPENPSALQVRPPRLEESHCSPASRVPSPHLLPLPPRQAEVSNRQPAPQESTPEVYASKLLQPVTVPHEEPSHCSPASITPSPQLPPVREVHAIVSKAQDGPQRRMPPANPRLEQPETGPQLAPSHCSPWSITPSPQELPAPPWHAAVSNWQSPPQVSAPETNASKSAQLLTVPHEVRSHCSPESIVPSPQFPPVVEVQLEVSNSQKGEHRKLPPEKPRSMQVLVT